MSPAAQTKDGSDPGRRGSARSAKRRRRKTGPDSRYSWVVAMACAGVNVFMHASSKVVGLLFFGMLSEFAVSREAAAWPLVLNNTLLNLAGEPRWTRRQGRPKSLVIQWKR